MISLRIAFPLVYYLQSSFGSFRTGRTKLLNLIWNNLVSGFKRKKKPKIGVILWKPLKNSSFGGLNSRTKANS